MNNKKITNLVFIAILFCGFNSTVLAGTVEFETITEALDYSGDKSTVTKLVITGNITGSNYSKNSEWSKFINLNETYPALESIEILTSQDIPDIDIVNRFSLFTGFDTDLQTVSHTTNWLKNFSAPNVKYIGIDAFYNCGSLVSVNFPEATIIAGSAFENCFSLVSADFPLAHLIRTRAFAYCSSLTSINAPNIQTVMGSAFFDCNSLVSVDFPLLQTMGRSAFFGCINLTSINFPKVTTVGDLAFYACSSLVSVDFPEVKTIGSTAFRNCVNLTSINFPKITTLGDSVFRNCTQLVSVNFETESEVKFGLNVFLGVPTQNIELTLGENVLPLPDLDANTWQTNNGEITGTPYVWKIIKTTGIEEIIKNRTISIFPNPATSYFTVSFELEKSCNIRIVLSDVLGQELIQVYDGFADAGIFSRAVNTENLATGIYFLKVLIGSKFTVEKIVVY